MKRRKEGVKAGWRGTKKKRSSPRSGKIRRLISPMKRDDLHSPADRRHRRTDVVAVDPEMSIVSSAAPRRHRSERADPADIGDECDGRVRGNRLALVRLRLDFFFRPARERS